MVQVSLEDFLPRAKVKDFKSSRGKTYRVVISKANQMSFVRLQTKSTEPWSMDLRAIHQAYQELDDFDTRLFFIDVPKKHSPARGLLLHLKLLLTVD